MNANKSHNTKVWAQHALACGVVGLSLCNAAFAGPVADKAIASFNAVCFTAGQTEAQARNRMVLRDGTPLPYALTFWDTTLEPAAQAPATIERRCKVSFDGEYTQRAVSALRRQMATLPVFGFAIPLPHTHQATDGTALIQGRELLRGRVAVVEIGRANGQTFMTVDRLPPHWEDL